MAKVLLLSTASPDDPNRPHPFDELNRMRRSAECDTFGKHQLTENPGQADIILFVENCDTITHYFEVRNHPYLKNYRDKCFLFSKYDHPIPFLPGVYASIERRWYDKKRTRSGGYLKAFAKDFIAPDLDTEQSYLYSFMGSVVNHPVREKLLTLQHDRQYVRDTSQLWPYGELEGKTKEEFHQHYVDVCYRSAFMLCPRGRGASSIRLFECLRMGRAPVIISDAWVPPEGPDWEAISVRVAEKNVGNLPHILEQYEAQADEMGRLARRAWENWFAAEAFFHRTVESCLSVKDSRTRPEALLRFRALPQLLQPLHLKALARLLLSQRMKRLLQNAS